MSERFNAVLRLRRDNDFNYAKIANSFVPADGEICLVDTASSGLRIVCGDGSSPFGELNFIDDILAEGYFNNGIFYKDFDLLNPIAASTNKIYFDYNTQNLYIYDGTKYNVINSPLPTASSSTAGMMKLYSTIG